MAEPTTYPIATIAKLLDISPRRIRQLVDEGVIPREERGRYALVPAVRGYIQFLRERAVNADVGSDELGRHRARKLKAEAEQAEMKSAEMRSELLPRDEVHVAVTTVLALVRGKILALPSKAAPLWSAAQTTAEAQAIIKDACHDALNELAATNIAELPKDVGIEPPSD